MRTSDARLSTMIWTYPLNYSVLFPTYFIYESKFDGLDCIMFVVTLVSKWLSWVMIFNKHSPECSSGVPIIYS